MKKIILSIALFAGLLAFNSSCRESKKEGPIEIEINENELHQSTKEALDEMERNLEEAGKEIEKAAEDVEREIHDATH